MGGFLCLCFTAMASKRQINGQQNSASPCVPCGANLLRVIIKLRKLEKGWGGAESRQFNKPHQIMTSVIGFCIKRRRERACAFKYDSDEICLSLFSRTYVRAGDEKARSFPAPARVYARHQSAVRVMTWMCVGVFCWLSLCVCVICLSLSLSFSLLGPVRSSQQCVAGGKAAWLRLYLKL